MPMIYFPLEKLFTSVSSSLNIYILNTTSDFLSMFIIMFFKVTKANIIQLLQTKKYVKNMQDHAKL
jgi:hypothetical protein